MPIARGVYFGKPSGDALGRRQINNLKGVVRVRSKAVKKGDLGDAIERILAGKGQAVKLKSGYSMNSKFDDSFRLDHNVIEDERARAVRPIEMVSNREGTAEQRVGEVGISDRSGSE